MNSRPPCLYPAPGLEIQMCIVAPSSLHRCWGSKHRSTCLCNRIFTCWTIPPPLETHLNVSLGVCFAWWQTRCGRTGGIPDCWHSLYPLREPRWARFPRRGLAFLLWHSRQHAAPEAHSPGSPASCSASSQLGSCPFLTTTLGTPPST